MGKQRKTRVHIETELADKFDEMACASGFSSREEAIGFLIEQAINGGVPEFWREPTAYEVAIAAACQRLEERISTPEAARTWLRWID